MGCGYSEEEVEVPRADRARRTTTTATQGSTTSGSVHSPTLPVARTNPLQSTPSKTLMASPPQSANKDIGKSYKGMQLGTEQHQSKSYTERKHLEEVAFKKALKQQANKPKEPSVKELEQEIITKARGSMFDLSLLTEQADNDELEELRGRYEEVLADVTVASATFVGSKGHERGELAHNTIVAASHSALVAALKSMKIPRMNEALVEPYADLP